MIYPDHVLTVIDDADKWLDGACGPDYVEQPRAQDWARVAKVAEEVGEAVSALIAFTGQNPRKGVCGTLGDLLGELADVTWTAVLAIQHFTKDPMVTDSILAASLKKLEGRINLLPEGK